MQLIAKDNNTYDAVIVGSGATGGWVAKTLAEAGTKSPCRGEPLCQSLGLPFRDISHVHDRRMATRVFSTNA